MQGVVLCVLLSILTASCVPLGPHTEGTSGPLAWHVIDLKSTSAPGFPGTIGEAHGTYACTLVLKETQGVPLTFTYRKDTIYAAPLTVLTAPDGAIHLRFRPHQERRVPLTLAWGCPAGDCRPVDAVAPRWTITLTGTDAQGHAVQAIINLNLPPNPATYRQPAQTTPAGS